MLCPPVPDQLKALWQCVRLIDNPHFNKNGEGGVRLLAAILATFRRLGRQVSAGTKQVEACERGKQAITHTSALWKPFVNHRRGWL